MTTTKKPEPNWNQVIDEILKEMEDDDDVPHVDEPVGIQEYHLSQHSKNISSLEAFDWSTEWIKERPVLLAWLEQKYEWWREDQLYDDDGFQDWLNGTKHIVHGDAYLDELQKKLISLYRERITETYECEECGKTISEKYPYGHPDSIVRIGIAVDGTLPRDEVEYVRHLYCDPCWRKRLGRKKPSDAAN